MTAEELSKKGVFDLRVMALKMGIKNSYKYTKDKLIENILKKVE